MEIKKALLTLSVIAALSPVAALAEQPSYNFVDAGYARMELDGVSLSPSGFFTEGSVSLNDNWFLQGGFLSVDDSSDHVDLEADQYSLGGGFRTELDDSTSLHLTAAYLKADVEAEDGVGQSASADEDGYGLGIGIRSMLTESFELNAGLDYSDSGDANGSEMSFGAAWYLTDNVGLVADVSFDDDSNMLYLLGGRITF